MKSIKQIVKQLKEIPYVETIIQFGSSLERENFRDIDICIITTRMLSMEEEISIRKEVSNKYDLNFYDGLPLHIKKLKISLIILRNTLNLFVVPNQDNSISL